MLPYKYMITNTKSPGKHPGIEMKIKHKNPGIEIKIKHKIQVLYRN